MNQEQSNAGATWCVNRLGEARSKSNSPVEAVWVPKSVCEVFIISGSCAKGLLWSPIEIGMRLFKLSTNQLVV